MSLDLSDEQINNILNQYKNKRMREKERYERIKDTDDFKNYNRDKSKKHYENNKDKYKEKYNEKKDLMKAKNSYYYYKRIDNLEAFKTKHEDRYNLLLIGGYLSE